MPVLPEYSFDRFVTVTYDFQTGFATSGGPITEKRTRQHWMKQLPLPSRDSVVWIADGQSENPSRWRTRWLPGEENQWKVGDRFTVDGVLYRVLGVQMIGRREIVELYTED